MKIIITSDLHGNLPIIEEPFDLLMICGDLSPAHDHYYAFQREWLYVEFLEWVESLPFNDENSKVVLVPGNHDFYLEKMNKNEIGVFEKKSNHRVVILKNKQYDYNLDNNEKISIFGTPYCKMFGNWAFMVNNDILEKKFSEIPDNIDILLSHDSPTLNKLGMINDGPYAGHDAGNPILDKYIQEKKPKYFFSGHLHSGNHHFEKVGDTMMANVAFVNEKYMPVYPLLCIEINNNKELISKKGIYTNYKEY